jgi:hypothetical protein
MGVSATFALATLIAGIFLAITWFLPVRWTKRFHIGEAEKQAEVEDSYRRTLAQILGGAAIVLGFAWTWIKDHDTIELTRIQTSNQQFGEAATLISGKSVDGRAAAIYSLGNLMQTRPEYITPVINILKSVIKTHQPKDSADGDPKAKISDDVAAAIYVLGRIPPSGPRIDMSHLYLVGGNFKGSTGFRGALFYSAALYATDFGGVSLTDAIFDGAQMADYQSVGSKQWSDQLAADWTTWKQWEQVQYVALFNDAVLARARFKGMSVAGAIFQRADLTGTKFEDTDLSRADFRDAKNLEMAIFTGNCYGPPGQPVGLSDAILKTLRHPCKQD